MSNNDFLAAITASFRTFLIVGTSRSTAKLKPLHGAIARDVAERLGADFKVLSQGYEKDCEGELRGRYMDKKVDVAILRDGSPVAGIAVKFVMQNYSQNSNNYFENMLGETANIRCNNLPYFQVFVILDRLPYYDRARRIKHWETFTRHNAEKYVTLSNDNAQLLLHTPNKTLLYVVHIPDNDGLATQSAYLDFYRDLCPRVVLSQTLEGPFGSAVIVNDYEAFAEKVRHAVLAL